MEGQAISVICEILKIYRRNHNAVYTLGLLPSVISATTEGLGIFPPRVNTEVSNSISGLADHFLFLEGLGRLFLQHIKNCSVENL